MEQREDVTDYLGRGNPAVPPLRWALQLGGVGK